MNNKGSTSNAILVIILVVLVGFVVWYVTSTRDDAQQEPALQLNLGSTGDGTDAE